MGDEGKYVWPCPLCGEGGCVCDDDDNDGAWLEMLEDDGDDTEDCES